MQETPNFNKENEESFDELVKKRDDLDKTLKSLISERDFISDRHEERGNDLSIGVLDNKIKNCQKQIEEIEEKLFKKLTEEDPKLNEDQADVWKEKVTEIVQLKKKVVQLQNEIQNIEKRSTSKNNEERRSASEEERFKKIQLCSVYQAQLNALTAELFETRKN